MPNHNRLQRFSLLFFFLVSLIDIIAIVYENSLWQTISKPLIIPALMTYYITSSASRNKFYILALFFSFTGDVLLLDKSNLFLFGIGAFLVTQVLYVYIFSKGLNISSRKQKLQAITPFIVFFIVLINALRPGLHDFFIPVVIYGIAISAFGSVSLLKYLIQRDAASQRLLAGALLFIISDSVIALHKFHEPRSIYPVAIMLTYIAAQYLIAVFMLRSEKKVFNSDE